MNTLVRIPVTDAADLMAMRDDGKNWASLRYMCDYSELMSASSRTSAIPG